MIKKSLLAVSAIALLGFSGCSQHLGQFTIASTNNVRNLHYNIQDKTKVRTDGYSCARNIFGIPINQQDDLLQRAMDNTISNGQAKGVDGDALVNVRINSSNTILIIYNDTCYEVQGDLIKIKDK